GECADAVTRQLREEVRQVGARGVPVQSEAALGEGDVPAVPGGDPFEGGASAAGADEDEGGGFGVTAEGRHAGFPAGGDEVPAPALLVDVPVEPAVVDAADLADVFEESAHIPLEVTQALRGASAGTAASGVPASPASPPSAPSPRSTASGSSFSWWTRKRAAAASAAARGSGRWTSAATVRVSSRVRPSRECRPNSSRVLNARRSPTSSQVDSGMRFLPASSRLTRSTSCRSGGTTEARSRCPGTAARLIREEISSFSGTPSEANSSLPPTRSVSCSWTRERRENFQDRLATKPARWAASCTESLKISVLRRSRLCASSLGSSPPVNSWVTTTEASGATPAPR